MNWPVACVAVIPCLNEAAAIGGVVKAVQRHIQNVLVIDDGSTDDTSALARAAGAKVLRHASPRGKGAALEAGWREAFQSGFQWALTMDGDGQHSPDDISAFFHCAEQTSAALVVGNRMAAPGAMPWLRRCVNHWMSRRLSKLARCPMPDSQNGFRLMNLQAWSALSISAAHFEIESEVLLAFARSRRRIEFVPVQVIYEDEQSKINPLRDTLRWLRWWRERKRQAGVEL